MSVLHALLLIIAAVWKSATWSLEAGLYLLLVVIPGSAFTLIALLQLIICAVSVITLALATFVRHLVTHVSFLAPAGV